MIRYDLPSVAIENVATSSVVKLVSLSIDCKRANSSDLSLISNGLPVDRQSTPESELSTLNEDELQSHSSTSSYYASGVNIGSNSDNMLLVAAIRSTCSNNVKTRMKALKCLFKIATRHRSNLPYFVDSFFDLCFHRFNDTSILIRKMVLNLLMKAPISTNLKTTETLDVAIERSKDVGSAVRKKSVQLLSKLYTYSENQTSRVKILSAIMMATVDLEQAVSNAAVKAARDFLFGDDFCQMVAIERAELLLLTTESLYNGGHVEIMRQLYVQCKDGLVPSSSEIHLARDLASTLLHQYIATDTPGNPNGNLFNILGYIISDIIKIQPEAITIADIHLMSSSVDTCEEKKTFCILTILEAVSWKKFLQHKSIMEELKRLISNMIRKPLSYRALEKSVNCLCLIDSSKSIKVSKTALTKLIHLVHGKEISMHAHDIVILSVTSAICACNSYRRESGGERKHEESNIHLLNVVKEMLYVVRWSIRNESSQRDIDIIGKSAIRCLGILLYARPDLLTSQPILQLFDNMINTASNELKIELLYVLKKLLLKEYENDNEELQQTEHFTKWSAPALENSKHNSVSAIVQAHFKNITDLVLVNDIYMQTAVVSVMTEIVKQGIVPPSMASIHLIENHHLSSRAKKLMSKGPLLVSSIYCTPQHKYIRTNFKKVLLSPRIFVSTERKFATQQRD
ncbi:hypothetical protein K450DRAFT_270253 [Umbelopsis ramanniana AG]|uniref:Uncharacterized protein n=1 Tax=Umbelopsis ramanniana AG TaxID=1314678 RepID=A0AAD5ECH5_UMBRA|nr:uncharacterized protein K450DRAFT_270253 [Umbelopsis ramanniana AG]KAI8581391.1 hypothetical protein K450DRAFT_270253 [Umbelopsis ramanniana AG]